MLQPFILELVNASPKVNARCTNRYAAGTNICHPVGIFASISFFIGQFCGEGIHSPKLTCSPLKDAGWETTFLLGWPIFMGSVSKVSVSGSVFDKGSYWKQNEWITHKNACFFFKRSGVQRVVMGSCVFCFLSRILFLPFSLKKMWWCGAFMVKKHTVLVKCPSPKKETSTLHISLFLTW